MARCPHCDAVIRDTEAPPSPGPTRDLLDDVLDDVRRLDREQRATVPSERAASGLAPGKFEKLRRPRRRTNWGYSVLVAFGIVLIATAAYLSYAAILRGIAEDRAEDLLGRVNANMPLLQKSVSQADEYFLSKDYPSAARAYRSVVQRGDEIMARLRRAPANLPPGALQTRLAAVQQQVLEILRNAQAALESPEVKYGDMGLMEYDGQWVTVAERDRLHAQRMKDEGRQLYEGEWLTEAEIHQRKGEVLYQGRWISGEQYAKLAEREGTEAIMTPPAPPPRVPSPPTFDPTEPVWVLNDFEGADQPWANVSWTNANPCRLSVEEKDGSRQLRIQTQYGRNDKCAIVRRLTTDVRSRSKITMDITNTTGIPVGVAIAVETNRFYESKWRMATMNLNKQVTFDLHTADYKCAPHWTYFSSITNLNQTRWLYILVYHNRPGDIYIDNIVALGQE